MTALISVFSDHRDLLALSPEDLGGVLLEIGPGEQQRYFSIDGLCFGSFQPVGPSFSQGSHRPVTMALAEALSWLVSQGLLVRDPDQPGHVYSRTRRAKDLRTRADVTAFQRANVLPVDLLDFRLAEKVRPLFLRGDHDTAVFQAFKEIEVFVRLASKAAGTTYPDDLVGMGLMRKAFHADTGPLRDHQAVFAEREAEAHLFAGAIGHAKNPTSHRKVNLDASQAARLIVFASHLYAIVDSRFGL